MMASNRLKTIPYFIYGTAWKKERTQELVTQAINAGFRAVDTAAQPKHYTEDLVGAGLRAALKDNDLSREDVWVQTKFTPVSGQAQSHMPYDARDSLTEQVKASLASSFHNLQTSDALAGHHDDYIDAVLLHSPFPTLEQTIAAWRTMTEYVPDRIRYLGISNVSFSELREIYDAADVAPHIVQNSFHAGTGFDARIRDFCREKGMVYQSFWTLTANPHLLHGEHVSKLSGNAAVSAEVALYALVAFGLDVRVLNGTTSEKRMREDISGMEKVWHWRQHNKDEWMKLLSGFKGSLSRGRTM